MTKTHTFDDGIVVELDDDVEVEDLLAADDGDEDPEVHAVRLEAAEARLEEIDDPDDEPEGIEVGA